MILSNKFLQPVKRSDKHDPCCICASEKSPRFFYDPMAAKFYCAEHTTFEDLDPGAHLNQSYLHGVKVSRLAAFPELVEVKDLFTLPGNKLKRVKGAFYMRVENHPATFVSPTPVTTNWLVNNLLYASADPDHYFFDVFFKDWEGVQYAYISVAYQSILGSRLLGIVPASNLYDFLGVKHD